MTLHRRLLVPLLLAVGMIATLLPVPSQAQGAAVTVHIEPAIDGNTAVRDGQAVEVSGEAPAGETITSARLVGHEADGGTVVQTIGSSARNSGPRQGSWLQNNGGALEGELVLGCRFGDPEAPCVEPHGPVRTVVLELTMSGGADGASNALRVDFTRPFIRRYDLVSPTEIKVIFSEPVRHPQGGDSALDWRVTDPDRTVVDVRGPSDGDCTGEYLAGEDPTAGDTGCTRTIVLGQAVDEDASPFVRYNVSFVPERSQHEDFASNDAFAAAFNAQSNAIDNIRPAIPDIREIDGRSPSGTPPEVVSNDSAPVVRVGNLTEGHHVYFRGTRPDGSSFDFESAAVRAGSDGVNDVEMPALTGRSNVDERYQIEVVARDPEGNRSTDAQKSPPRSDASPSSVAYQLDTIAPRFGSAELTGAREITVTLTEAVVPSGDAGSWRVNGQQVSAAGEGRTRRLTTGGDLPPTGNTVSWEAAGSSYTDPAGNTLVAFQGRSVLDVPPIPAPSVTLPAAEVYTTGSSTTIGGESEPDLRVDIVERDDPETVRASTSVDDDGTWTVDLALPDDGRRQLQAAAVHPSSGLRSPLVTVPDIIRDTAPPEVDVSSPDQMSLTEEPDPTADRRRHFAVGDGVPVRWTAEDPAPGDPVVPDHGDRVDIDIRLDGAGPRPIDQGTDLPYTAEEEQSFSYVVQESDLGGAATREARFGVTVTDRAGNANDPAQDASAAVLLRRDLVGYVAAYTLPMRETRPAEIQLRFPVPIEGPIPAPGDFEVRDELGNPLPVTVGTFSDDRRTLTLRVVGITDPNATPEVRYNRPLLAERRLTGPDGLELSQAPRLAIDEVEPLLQVDPVDEGPRQVTAATFSGTTDETARPNTVRVRRDGRTIASTVAGGPDNRQWSVQVPIEPNRRNELVVEAIDPATNSSGGTAVTVIEDSRAPVVDIASPPANSQIERDGVEVRWTTQDAHPHLVDIAFRTNGGRWQPIANKLPDEGRFDWDVDEDVDDFDVLDFRVTATDAAGLTGSDTQPGLFLQAAPGAGGPPGDIPGGGGEGPPPVGGEGITAIATGERTIDVTFPQPVETARGAAGFSVFRGPGVQRVSGVGATRTLVLSSDLSTTTPLVVYNGDGVSHLDGRSVEEFRIRAARGFAFSPQGLVGDLRDGTARLSWTDERNTDGDIVRYEIRRDGDVVGTVPGSARSFDDAQAGDGVVTYSVTAIDDLDHVSSPATIRLDPDAPNITPAGGFVLSPDGEVALIVPPQAVRKDHYGRFESVGTGGTAGYGEITSGYRLVVEAADDRSQRLTAFERFSCLSFRPGRGVLGSHEPFRVMGLRLLAGDAISELATRTGRDSAESCMLTTGDFALGEAAGASTRVIGGDPVLGDNRFATAAALSQSSFAAAGAAVVARADDFPDALAASSLAAQLGGPVLLSNTDELPLATVLELHRLGAERVVLAGGTAALSDAVAEQATAQGFAVERVAGATRFETAAAIAERVGSFGGRAFLATGEQFPDALAGSAPSSMLTRPILLTGTDEVPQATLDALGDAGVTDLTILGGSAAVSDGVEAGLRSDGFTTRRAAGPTRIETAVALANSLRSEGLLPVRPIAASGEGVGKTSPDALAAGPIAGRFAAPLLLVPTDELGGTVADALRRAGELRGISIAGGVNAVSERTRREIDAATR